LKRLFILTLAFLLSMAGLHHIRINQSQKASGITGFVFEVKENEFEKEEENEKHKADEPNKFMEFHRGIRTRDGESAPGYTANQKWTELKRARQLSFARRKNGSSRLQNEAVEFKERGPGNVPGRTRSVLSVPGDPADNTWLAGSATGGIWRTTNGGTTWTEVSKDFAALPISSFATTTNGSVIYAGSGEQVSSVYSAIGNGIYKSTDKGLTWSVISSTENNSDFSIVTRLVVNPDDANMIVATTAKSNLIAGATSMIMRTIDGGNSWTKVQESSGVFEQIVATPGNFNILYASENGVGVWKSTNAGATWSFSNTGMSPAGRVEIAISPASPSKLFASAEGTLSGNASDLYYSSNAGTTWSLIDVRFNNTVVDFFEGQGFYDNTILCDPFDDTKVYFGGVSLFRTTLTTGSTNVNDFKIAENGTTSFMFLQSFANIPFDNQRLDVVTEGFTSDIKVEVRFGPGEAQSAHRFLVPDGATSGVPAASYSYNNYVTVPFEVWDVTNNRQLMVSFRDQNRNGKFDLVPPALAATDAALNNSREYVYIHNITYSATASTTIAVAGGHEQQRRYTFFPALATGAVWDENTLPVSKLIIENHPIPKLNATTVTVADGRDAFDQKNGSDQQNLAQGVHPDHHFIIPLNLNATAKTYRLLLCNDGGVFVSKISTSPGTAEGDWEFKGLGLNTTQFYGADKAPGIQRYIGGAQDNGTRISSAATSAIAQTGYSYAIGGDGFEVIWNNSDANKIMGCVYNGSIYRTTNGTTWSTATSGFTPSATEFSFVTKIANSKDYPDRVFTAGTSGVYVSNDFGGQWTLTPIASNFVLTTPFYLDVEVSRANASIVWAGSGMNNSGTIRKLHVSTNGGKTFSATNNFTTVPLGNLTKLASHPTQPNTAYALFSFAKAPKILRTTDLGQTWQDISGFGAGTASTTGFPDVAIYCLYVRTDDPNIIWAGTEIGIVESTDNGATWALREDFPNVSVWDMKGQDNEVVIATHGRGIWSAILSDVQQSVTPPSILASGTSPQEKFMLRIQAPSAFDSIQVFVSNVKSLTLENVSSGTIDAELSGITTGEKDVILVGYKGTAPYQSMLKKVTQIDVLPPQATYSTYFDVLTDLTVDGMTLQFFANSNSNDRATLQSGHNYLINKNHSVLVRTPVTVSTTLPTLFYRDIAIVEPNQDSIVVEATKNGLDWVSLRDSYDASFSASNGQWLTAYNAQAAGSKSMFVDHEIDITDSFNPGDLLLFRLRMVSGPATTAWGWAIDYIAIQEVPLGVEQPQVITPPATLYPNPSKGTFTIDYRLLNSSNVILTVTDVFGKQILKKDLGVKTSGIFSEPVTLPNVSAGTYMIILHTNEGKKTAKLLLRE
jgi:photosystem II stability/assembly factor-like uncharacterized protein